MQKMSLNQQDIQSILVAYLQDDINTCNRKKRMLEFLLGIMPSLNLDNYTSFAHLPLFEEDFSMAKDRIRRRVMINGKSQWVTASTEQEYADKLMNVYGDKPLRATKHNFKEYADHWFEVYSKPNIEKVTAITYERQLRKHIYPILGEKFVEDITVDDVQRIFNEMDGVKETKNKTKMVLNMVLDCAVEDGIINKNPVKSKKVKLYGQRSKETKVYTIDQMRFMVRNLSKINKKSDRLYLAIQIAHPLRLEEVLGLKWQDIDLENQLLHIERAVTHPNRNQPVVKDTKTNASQRTIAIVPEIIPILEETRGNDEDFVVGGEKPLSCTQVRRMCERIQKDMGFTDRIIPIRFRTTVLTDIYDVTKDITQAQAAAGHATSATTLRHYVKSRGDSRVSANAIANAYGFSASM